MTSAATKLAIAPSEPTVPALPLPYLTFSVASELFAVPIGRVREVIAFPRITQLPLAPAAVPGVINLRGAVLPVVDLAVRLGRAPTSVGRRTSVVVMNVADGEDAQPIGVIIDAIGEAIEVPAHSVERRPELGCAIRDEFVAALLNLNGRLITVLELDRTLAASDLSRLVGLSVRGAAR